jgi:hypothetical protein
LPCQSRGTRWSANETHHERIYLTVELLQVDDVALSAAQRGKGWHA